MAAGSGQHWWSDALNDPWRNPESEARIVTTAAPPEPPAPPFAESGRTQLSARLLVTVAVVAGLLAGALGGAIGYVAAVSRERPVVLGTGSRIAPPPSLAQSTLPY